MQINRAHLEDLIAKSDFDGAKTYIRQTLQMEYTGKSFPFIEISEITIQSGGKLLKLVQQDTISVRLSKKQILRWLLICLALVGYCILSYALMRIDWATYLLGGIGLIGSLAFLWKIFDNAPKLLIEKDSISLVAEPIQSIDKMNILTTYIHKRKRHTTYEHPDDHLVIFPKKSAAWYEWPIYDLELTPEEIGWVINAKWKR